ncbi:MAG: Type 1 glutamine amidotransferase-like domain-containing protein [Patescibacteria group bacterium]|jgi:peptidase E
MSTLLLTSDSKVLHNSLAGAVGKPEKELKALFMITASMGIPDRAYVARHREVMQDRGIAFEEYDCEGKSLEEHRAAFEGQDVLIVIGGNPFHLLEAVRVSRFDQAVYEFIDRGGVYSGGSAGAYIACPDIGISELSHWNTPEYRGGLSDLTAMDLVPFYIKAHYLPEQEEEMRAFAEKAAYPLRVLKDGQGLLVRDGNVEFIGEGEEVIL